MATCADALRKANDRFITKVQLDLDCEFRPNGTQLTNEAKQRDVLLSRAIFEHFRKGSIDDAIDVAIQYNEPWRVATFNGAKYLHYPLPNDYEQEFSGNFNRTQFKKRMEKLSSYPKFNPYERALYALLSGNLNQLIPICTTFEDYLWAMISCEIDKRVEFYIESKLSELENRQNRKSFNFMTLNQMLKQCKEFPTDPPYNQNNCFNIIQDFLIRGEFEHLFQYAKVALHSADSNWNNPSLKRFFAHLYIYLTQNGIELDSTCLITYINELQSVPSRMVALYCSKLPLKDQTLAYSSFLIKLKKDKALRDEFIRYASGYGLSVKDIIMQTAELAMHHALGSLPDLLDDNLSIDEPLPTYDSSRTKKSDQLLVDSISWVVNNPSTYLESAQLANKIIRKFLIRGKLYQARQLIKAIPDTVREEWVSFQAREYFEDDQLMASPELIKLSIVEFAQHTQLVNCFRIIWRLRQSFKENLTPENDGFTDWKKELENLINNMELCFSEFSGTQYLNYPTSLDEDNISENEILRRLYIPELLIQIHSAYLLTSDVFHDNPQRSLEQLLPFYTAEQAGEHFELLNLTNRLKETTELIKLTSVKMLDLEGIKHRKPAQTPNYQEFRIRF
jgi:nuclear pore complex protein Nup107